MPNDSPASGTHAHLHLVVVGAEAHSSRARNNLTRVPRETRMEFDVTVTDVLTNYREALDNGVLIAPTLFITTSEVGITVAGDLSDAAKLKAALSMV